jgi:hypothetical protein
VGLPADLLAAVQAAYDGASSKDASYAQKFEYARLGTGQNRKKVYVWVGWSPVENRAAPGEIWVRVFPNPGPG